MEALEKGADQGSAHLGHGDKGKLLSIGTSLTRCYTECADCRLFSVCRGICFYCEQEVKKSGDEEKEKEQENTHDTHEHTPQYPCVHHTSAQNTALQTHLVTGDHAIHHPCRVGCQTGEGRHQSAEALDHTSDAGTLGGDPRPDGPHTTGAPISTVDERPQSGVQEEGRDLSVCPESRWPDPGQHDHCSALWNGGTDHHRTIPTNREGDRGLWTSRTHDLRGGGGNRAGLPGMGDYHCPGESRRVMLATAPFGGLGPATQARERHDHLQETFRHQGDRRQTLRHQPVHGELHEDHQQGQHHGSSVRDCGIQGPRDYGPEGTDRATRKGEGGGSSQAFQEPEGDVRAAESECFLSETMAAKLMREWQPQKNPYSGQWQTLVQHQRPLLMELACYSDSLLSGEVLQRFGAGSAIRCSEWNGGNLETSQGVAHAKELIRQHRPIHLWISCTCGPFCPLQRLNRRNEHQIQNLETKQQQARLQYKGAMEVARYAKRHGTQVHWEFSERSEAWQLPEVQRFLEELRLEKVTCHGCAVGLRTKDKKLPLCKGWTIATQNEELLQHLNLRCQKNHVRGKCEAGQTAHTARYTTPFVRKVVDSLSMQESWPRTLQELNKEETAMPAEEEKAEDDMREGEDFAEGEKEEIEKKIQHIHRATGHGSMKNLVEALEKRGVPPKVLQVAKQWKCPMCETYKKQDPRRFSTLETIPRRWQRVQMDMGSWCHPRTKKKFHFLMMVDEGSRFRMGRIVSYNPANNTTWTTIQQVFTESWLPIFGQPQVLRVDPQGPMMSNQADQYASEHGILVNYLFLRKLTGKSV